MKFFNLLIVGCLVILSGCTSTDMTTVMLLNQRLERMETAKQTRHYETVEINETVYVWKKTGYAKEIRNYRINVIVDENGNFLIPPEKITRRFEIRN